MSRDGVEEDEDGLPEERPGADTDEEDDDEGEDGVEIVLVLPVGQPDHGGADQDHHAAESVRQNVEEDAANIHLRSGEFDLLHTLHLRIVAVTVTVA